MERASGNLPFLFSPAETVWIGWWWFCSLFKSCNLIYSLWAGWGRLCSWIKKEGANQGCSGEKQRGAAPWMDCREGGVESPWRDSSSLLPLFAIRHIFLACSHESMCLPAASCKLWKKPLSVSEKTALAQGLRASDWLHTGLELQKNQTDVPSKGLEAEVWRMPVIQDEITHLELLSPALELEKFKLLNFLRCPSPNHHCHPGTGLYFQAFDPATSGKAWNEI